MYKFITLACIFLFVGCISQRKPLTIFHRGEECPVMGEKKICDHTFYIIYPRSGKVIYVMDDDISWE